MNQLNSELTKKNLDKYFKKYENNKELKSNYNLFKTIKSIFYTQLEAKAYFFISIDLTKVFEKIVEKKLSLYYDKLFIGKESEKYIEDYSNRTNNSSLNNINYLLENQQNRIKQYPDFLIKEQLDENQIYHIIDAKYKITKRKENINSGKITAELTFGFWAKLFNAKYELLLWKPLRLSFPNMPKSIRQRHKLSAPINRIRNLRNRIYHYEPIIWHIETVEKQIAECYDLLNWINADLPEFAREFDSIHTTIDKINKIYLCGNY